MLMKRVIQTLLLAAALAPPLASYAAISGTKVWGASATVSNGAWPATVDLTGHTPTAGNILVLCQARNDDKPSMTATTPSGWTAGPEYANGSAGALAGAMFWKKSAGNETSISVTWSDTTYGGSWTYVELPGTDLNVDAVGDSGDNEANVASATTSLSSGSATNSTATGLAVACLMTDNGLDNDVSGWSGSYNEQQESNYTSGGTAYAETFTATKVLSSSASQSTAGTITSDQGYGGILVFNASGSTCPATCAGERSARCITDTSNNTDPNNILYGQSPAVVANEDTVCYDATSALGDTVNVTTNGYPSFASAGKTATDSFTYTINDNGTGEGTPGKYETSFQPVISSVTGVATGQTTADITVTPSGPTEGAVQSVAISKTSYDTYGAPTHAQIRAGVDGNNSNVAWGSEFTKSFLTTVSPGWTFSRASIQTYTNSSGNLATVTSGNPAFNYSGGSAQGVLLEGSRTNLAKYSEALDNAAWSKVNDTTVTANQSAGADGNTAADRITFTTGGTGSPLRQGSLTIVNGTTYTVSAWVQSISGGTSLRFNLGNSVSGDITITGTPTRYTTQIVADATAASNGWLDLESLSGAAVMDVWGVQMEAGTFASSYIPTTTAPVTRQPTSLTRSWNTQTNVFSGYIIARPAVASTYTATAQPLMTLYKDANNYLTIVKPTTAGRMDMNLAIGGTTATAQVTGLTWAKRDKLDIRFRKNASGIKLWVEGSAVETTTGIAPNAFTTPPDSIKLGVDQAGASGDWIIENTQFWNSVDDTALGALNP